MELKALRHLVALVEHQGFIRAGEAIGLSQPALSRSIQNLEQRLGCPLINRSGKGIELTPQGQLVLEHARRLLAGNAAMRNALRQFNDLQSGELLIGAGPFPAASLVPVAMGRFNQRYPGVRVKLDIQHWIALRAQLLADSLELFIADIRELENDPQLAVVPLQQQPSVLFCRAEHPLLNKPRLSREDFAAYPLASFRVPEPVMTAMRQALPKADPVINLECDNLDVLKRLVQHCDALSIATLDVIALELANGTLVLLDWPELMPGASYGLVTRVDRPLSPSAQAFITLLHEVNQEGRA